MTSLHPRFSVVICPFFVLVGAGVSAAGCGDDEGPPVVDDGGGGGVDGGPVGSDGGPATGDGGGDGGPTPDGGGLDSGVDGGPVSMPCTAVGACDPFDVTSCPDGEACRPGVGGTECVASPGTLGVGETCTTMSQCSPGLLCLDFGEGFLCQRMCPDGSIGFCGDPLEACFGAIGGDMCIRICRPIPEPCDIYMQDCADPTDACTFARHPETGAPYTGCRPEGPQAKDEPCGGDDGFCMRGLVCVTEMGVATCRQVCGPDGAPPACGAGESCTGFARTWMVPYCR